ncbi:MAG TPA: rRNA maturation RNase YbeY [Gemmatimonadales bacterium]|nr:rRNA maturation RNase YbeY [Gemmatimonadales bacterium]
MPRTRAAERPAILVAGRCAPLGHAEIRAAAARALGRERRRAALSISFVRPDRIRALNARWKGRRALTDVLAFSLGGPDGGVVGDIYICPGVAAREARARGLALREELLRLVIHGTLHVLGWDHPEGEGRTVSPMWRRQERLVKELA